MPLNDGAINEILPFAPDGLESSGDLMPLAEYADDNMRLRGHQPGLARRGLQNRAQRQAAHVVAGMAQFVANRHAAGVRDDGDLDAVEDGLKGAVREEAEVVRDDSCRGFTSEGQHVAYEADLAAIDRNSLYAVQQGVATGLPEDMPADVWGFVHTMVLPGDAARTQLLWSVDDPDHPGWWRRRSAGVWGDWQGVGGSSDNTAAMRDMMGGDIVLWGAEAIPVLADGLPKGLELNGDVVSLETFPRLLRKWCGATTNATAEAFYRCTDAGVRDVAGTHIRLLDMRGVAPRGWDNGRGLDAARVLLSYQDDDFASHVHTQSRNSSSGSLGNKGCQGTDSNNNGYSSGSNGTGATGGSETRMKNVAVMFIIYV